MVECLLYVVNYIDYIEECYIPILNLSGTWFSVVGNGDNYIAIISSQTFFSFCKKKENSKKKKKRNAIKLLYPDGKEHICEII